MVVKDISGWHEQFKTGVWDGSSGEIMSRQRKRREPVGWLATDRNFMNFEFEFDYFLEREGNSGVFLRAIPGGAVNGANQLEVQLLDDNASTHQRI